MTDPRDPRPVLRRRDFLGRMLAFAGGSILLAGTRRAEAAPQSTEPFLGEIMPWSPTYAPRFWAECNGQLLPINQNQALFSLLGTTYGGNGVTTFALPDLRGRVPIGAGQGPGLLDYPLGMRGGAAVHTLSIAEMPAHGHVARGCSTPGTAAAPGSRVPARNAAQVPQYGSTSDVTLAAGALAPTGGSQPHDNMQPYTSIMFVISLSGVYPQP